MTFTNVCDNYCEAGYPVEYETSGADYEMLYVSLPISLSPPIRRYHRMITRMAVETVKMTFFLLLFHARKMGRCSRSRSARTLRPSGASATPRRRRTRRSAAQPATCPCTPACRWLPERPPVSTLHWYLRLLNDDPVAAAFVFQCRVHCPNYHKVWATNQETGVLEEVRS